MGAVLHITEEDTSPLSVYKSNRLIVTATRLRKTRSEVRLT